MVCKKLVLIAIGLLFGASPYAAGSQEQPPQQSTPLKLPPPPPLPTRVAQALFLEKVSGKLLQMVHQNCQTLITQTRSKIDKIRPQPTGYDKPYKAGNYYNAIIDQINQSFNDLKGKVDTLVSNAKASAKDPENEKDLIKIFETIYGEIDLNGRKNCEKYTSAMNAELDTQENNILMFNEKKPSLSQSIKNKFNKK
jgi:hypothetical protein